MKTLRRTGEQPGHFGSQPFIVGTKVEADDGVAKTLLAAGGWELDEPTSPTTEPAPEAAPKES